MLCGAQESSTRISSKVVDPLGNEIVSIRGSTRGSLNQYIKPAGSEEYQAIRLEPYRYIAGTPDFQEQGKRVGSSFYHSTNESCVEVKSSDGKVEYYLGPSSSDDLSQYRLITDTFKKMEGDFEVEQSRLSRLPVNRQTLDIYKLGNGEYIYFDKDVNHPSADAGARAYQGTPGNMREIEIDRFIPRPKVRCPAPNTYILGDGRKVVAGGMKNYIEQVSAVEQTEEPANSRRLARGGGCHGEPAPDSSPIEPAERGIDAKKLGITGLASEGQPIDYPSPCSMGGLGVAINEMNSQGSRGITLDSNRREYDIDPPGSSTSESVTSEPSSGSSSER